MSNDKFGSALLHYLSHIKGNLYLSYKWRIETKINIMAIRSIRVHILLSEFLLLTILDIFSGSLLFKSIEQKSLIKLRLCELMEG